MTVRARIETPKRTASCRCGQLTVIATGDPVRVSVCHCLDCQKRSGSAFTAQVRFPTDQVTIAGQSKTWSCTGDSGNAATLSWPSVGPSNAPVSTDPR